MRLSLTLCTLVALAGAARADNKAKADALFRQGKKLMAEKRYAAACEAFESSQQLDAGIGTQLNIAKCYEDWGKLGRALAAYRAAAKAATDANDPRAPKIHELLAKLEPEVPHLTIKIPKDAPPDLKVTLDDRPVDTFHQAFAVDPGPHTIEWSITGSAKRTKIVPTDRGGDFEVSLDMPLLSGAGGPATGGPQPTTDTSAPRGRTQRMAGIGLGGAGLVAIGVSSYMALAARSDYNDALDNHCSGMKTSCDTIGLELTHDARSTANQATIVFVVGAALVGGGVALYLLAPDGAASPEQQTVYVTPALSPDGVGVVLGGTL